MIGKIIRNIHCIYIERISRHKQIKISRERSRRCIHQTINTNNNLTCESSSKYDECQNPNVGGKRNCMKQRHIKRLIKNVLASLLSVC